MKMDRFSMVLIIKTIGNQPVFIVFVQKLLKNTDFVSETMKRHRFSMVLIVKTIENSELFSGGLGKSHPVSQLVSQPGSISLLISNTFNKEYKQKSSVELLVYFLIEIRNMSRSPLLSSWSISLLISYISNKEYKQKSSMELLVCSLLISDTSNKEYKQKSSVELLDHF